MIETARTGRGPLAGSRRSPGWCRVGLVLVAVVAVNEPSAQPSVKAEATAARQVAAAREPATAVQPAQETFKVPSDPKATYTVLERGRIGAERFIVTRRTGPSGTSYSKRLYDCKRALTRYLGTGDSLAELAASRPEPKMAPIISGSIADVVGGVACRQLPQ